MDTTVFPTNLHVQGRLTADAVSLPAAAIVNNSVASDAAIAASKLCHRIVQRVSQSGTAAASTQPLHGAYAAGQVLRVVVGAITAAVGDSTVTVDVKKGGTSILTAPIVFTSATAARTVAAGTLGGGATYAAATFFEVVITVSAGTGALPTGLYVAATFDESPL